MEIILVILMIVLALVSSGSKARKQRAANGQTPPQAAKAASPAKARQAAEAEEALAKAKERARRKIEAAKQQSKRQPDVPAPPKPAPAQPTVSVSREGMSAFDDEGCLGGSMPHGHAEGESRAEHGRHVAAMEARDREEAVLERKGLDARAMRRAVVMAEVLDRPVSLRARRRAG